MDKVYYIEKIKNTIDEELNKYKKFSLRDFILLNKEAILYTCNEVSLSAGIELLSGLILKLPANCELQKKLIKIVKEYLENEEK